MELAFNAFMIVGVVLLIAAAGTMGYMIYRYITGMRSQGFFGGKKKDEKE